MIFADAAPQGGSGFGVAALLCLGLLCLLVVSGIALAAVLYQRSRRKPPGGVA